MINNIITWSLNNRFLVILITILVTAAGLWSMYRVPLDAIPDISDTQVIVFVEWPGQLPNVIEDQVTYPIITSLTAAPNVKTVRGVSMMGASFIYIIFEDGTDIYWARTRVMEYMQGITSTVPPEAKVSIGPDASAVGWVYQYALVDKTGQHDLQELRTLQDWYIRYILQAVPGVAEVATVGGFEKQYVVEVDPNKLSAFGIPLQKVIGAIRSSNTEVGGRTVEYSGREYLVWGRGYVENKEDIEQISLGATTQGTPISIRDIGRVVLAPNTRRGMTELNGEGEVVGAVVAMRYGENALDVINRVKRVMDEEVQPLLPEGVEIVETYDRSDLIQRAVDSLKHTLTEEIIIVSIIILIFLMHLRSAFIPAIALPIAIVVAFIPMMTMKITANIMSLGGIAISIGVIVDAAVVMVDNAYRRLAEEREKFNVENLTSNENLNLKFERTPERNSGGNPNSGVDADSNSKLEWEKIRAGVILDSCKQVGRPIFFSLIIIVVSFLPVFLLEGQSGKLFGPLAWTKTLTLAASSILAITLIPVLITFLMRGRLRKDDEIFVVRWSNRIYAPIVKFALQWRKTVVLLALIGIIVAIPMAMSLGSEFMPPLEEGSLLYMPVTLPGVSIAEATRILQAQDRLIKSLPEVKSVYGKIGRHESSLDPAPISMVETVIILKPKSEWRPGVEMQDIIDELDAKVRFPGWTNAWVRPIQTRIDMLATGIRTPVGVKVLGDNLETLEEIAKNIENIARTVPGTRSAYAERVIGGTYLKITPKREALGRYGLSVEDALRYVSMAMGGMPIEQTVEGRERYTIAVRFPRELRNDIGAIQRIPVPLTNLHAAGGAPPTSSGGSMAGGIGRSTASGMISFQRPLLGPEVPQVLLGEIADIEISAGPQMVRDENGLLAAYVFIDIRERDLGGYVAELKETLRDQVIPTLPGGYTLRYSGQYEFQVRANERLMWLVPAVILTIFILLIITFGRVGESLLVMLSVPFALVGGVYLQWLIGWNWSVAVSIGYIALFGIAVETGVVMVIYLEEALNRRLLKGDVTEQDIRDAAYEGAASRLRPKLMTVGTTLIGITPVMWSTGTGSDVMKPIATPLIGGVVSSTVAILIVLPVLFYWMKCWQLKRGKLTALDIKH